MERENEIFAMCLKRTPNIVKFETRRDECKEIIKYLSPQENIGVPKNIQLDNLSIKFQEIPKCINKVKGRLRVKG